MKSFAMWGAASLLWLGWVAAGTPWASGQLITLQPGDRITVIGNTMAERMQHDGWLEALLHLRHPNHQLVVRELGFSADTVTTRLRSSGFGSPDDHLHHHRADVILMMFGYSESFAGPSGVASFAAALEAELQRLAGQHYNGEGPPRLVLISPMAYEATTRHRPDGRAINENLALYTEAMRRVAAAQEVAFVDVWGPSIADASQPAAGAAPRTINGVHLTSAGNRWLAEQIVGQLFGDGPPPDEARLEAVRHAVMDKNFYWFHKYRTTDGYSIFGGRGELAFVDRQTNREVMMRELEVLEAMVNNRDPAIWAAVRGETYAVDDSNTPPFLDVITNIPGPEPDGSHRFLSGEEAIGQMRVLEGFDVTLFASEADFPELVNPVQMAFDTRGRLWVAVWPTYPHWHPKQPMNDKLLILEDTTGDGRADRCTVFADGLHNPTGFEFWGGGVLVAQVPDLLFLRDTDGDDRCDERQRVLHGIDSADTHHSANSFVLGPDGALYFQEGVFHRTQVETPFGPVRNLDAACYRFEPRSGRFEVYISYPFANPHGHVFDLWGRDIIHDGTGSQPYDGALISGRLDFPHKHHGAPQVYQQRTRPCPATELVSAGHFPDEMAGQLLVQNVIGDLGILRYALTDDGASIQGRELEPLLLSSDPNFRPVDLEFAPDGTLYFIDWHNPIIGHMQHNLRDPSRDRAHGRVYRVRHTERPPLARPPEASMTNEALFEALLRGDLRTRYRARIELSARDSAEVLRDAELLAFLTGDEPAFIEWLWLQQQHQAVDRATLAKALSSSDPRTRAAAVRVATDIRDELSDLPNILLRAGDDEHPRVRLMAARGASFLSGLDGARVLACVAAHPRDRYVDYVMRESLRGIGSTWKSELGQAPWFAELPPESAAFLIEQLESAELARLPVTAANASLLLRRRQVPDTQRLAALEASAQSSGQSPGRILVDTLAEVGNSSADPSLVNDLVRLLAQRPAGEWNDLRSELLDFAQNSSSSAVRQVGLLGLIMADRGVEPTWELAWQHPQLLFDLAAVVARLPNPEWQWSLYPRFAALAQAVPSELSEQLEAAHVGLARYVRIELPGEQRILTLAEVEIEAGGVNVGPQGRASQSSVSHGGVAERAIDGNRDGRYARGGQTHTAEPTRDPWWEVELAAPTRVDKVRVFNRTEGEFYRRLDGFTLRLLDDQRQTVFEKREVAATRRPLELAVELPQPPRRLREAAMMAISHIVGREQEAAESLARMLVDEPEAELVPMVLPALDRVAKYVRDKELAQQVTDRLLALIAQTAATQRTHGPTAQAIHVVEALSTQLPPEAARNVRARLGDLVVLEIRLGTRPHRMAFDKTQWVVPAGRTIELILENTDLMPHNWVLVEPGALEAIGALAEAEANDPDALRKQYVPDSRQVLAASRLIQPQETLRITMTTPSAPGIYPYVCTYPGHWRRMFGAMIVVPSLEPYHANPAGYLAELGVEIRDPMLHTINRQQTDWTVDALKPVIEAEFNAGRDFENGRQMFALASCSSCHKLRGEGFELGPDLTQLDPNWTVVDLMAHLIEPSSKIDEKYQTQIFQLISGNIVAGIVVDENEGEVTIVENPLLASSATRIETAEIDARRRSDVSIMPKGLLDTLTKEEILDLLAFVVAGGDPRHEVFSGGN